MRRFEQRFLQDLSWKRHDITITEDRRKIYKRLLSNHSETTDKDFNVIFSKQPFNDGNFYFMLYDLTTDYDFKHLSVYLGNITNFDKSLYRYVGFARKSYHIPSFVRFTN